MKKGPVGIAVLGPDPAMQIKQNLPADCQSQSRSTRSRFGFTALGEFIEYPFQSLCWDAYSGIGNSGAELVFHILAGNYGKRYGDCAAIVTEFDRIRENISENLTCFVPVKIGARFNMLSVDNDLDIFLGRQRGYLINGAQHLIENISIYDIIPHLAGLKFREIEQAVDERQ